MIALICLKPFTQRKSQCPLNGQQSVDTPKGSIHCSLNFNHPVFPTFLKQASHVLSLQHFTLLSPLPRICFCHLCTLCMASFISFKSYSQVFAEQDYVPDTIQGTEVWTQHCSDLTEVEPHFINLPTIFSGKNRCINMGV